MFCLTFGDGGDCSANIVSTEKMFELKASRQAIKRSTERNTVLLVTSVTRLGDLLHFGELFKASGNNYFAKSSTFLGNLCKCAKIFDFSSEIIFGQL